MDFMYSRDTTRRFYHLSMDGEMLSTVGDWIVKENNDNTGAFVRQMMAAAREEAGLKLVSANFYLDKFREEKRFPIKKCMKVAFVFRFSPKGMLEDRFVQAEMQYGEKRNSRFYLFDNKWELEQDSTYGRVPGGNWRAKLQFFLMEFRIKHGLPV